MAMYENEGYCPNNSFLHYMMERWVKIPELGKRTYELLGERKAYMVYTEAGSYYNDWCYVVDALLGAKSTIGIEIAIMLKTLIPKCEYPKFGRKIMVTDVINPYQIPYLGRGYINNEETFISSDDRMHIFEDERYLCGVIDEGETVHMYFFKK